MITATIRDFRIKANINTKGREPIAHIRLISSENDTLSLRMTPADARRMIEECNEILRGTR